jgi:hypothetical protein
MHMGVRQQEQEWGGGTKPKKIPEYDFTGDKPNHHDWLYPGVKADILSNFDKPFSKAFLQQGLLLGHLSEKNGLIYDKAGLAHKLLNKTGEDQYRLERVQQTPLPMSRPQHSPEARMPTDHSFAQFIHKLKTEGYELIKGRYHKNGKEHILTQENGVYQVAPTTTRGIFAENRERQPVPGALFRHEHSVAAELQRSPTEILDLQIHKWMLNTNGYTHDGGNLYSKKGLQYKLTRTEQGRMQLQPTGMQVRI